MNKMKSEIWYNKISYSWKRLQVDSFMVFLQSAKALTTNYVLE